MKKKQMLAHWQALAEGAELRPAAVPYKHEGSTFAQDGLRITGSPEWIDAVLSRVKDLLAYENASTRLQVSYRESTDRETGAPMGSFNCYVQVHQRGEEAQMVNAFASSIAGREVIASRGY